MADPVSALAMIGGGSALGGGALSAVGQLQAADAQGKAAAVEADAMQEQGRRDENWFEFFDGGLVGSNNYFYAIRRIDKIGYSMNGVLQEKEVNGDSTSLLKIVAIDKSVPEKPIIKEINWLKDGTSNSDFIPDSRPKFTVKVTSKPSKVLIQKRKIGTDKWEVLSIEISVGETIEVKKEYIDWDSDLLTKDLTEAVFYDEIGYDYRAKLIGVNNLSSEYSEIISIN